MPGLEATPLQLAPMEGAKRELWQKIQLASADQKARLYLQVEPDIDHALALLDVAGRTLMELATGTYQEPDPNIIGAQDLLNGMQDFLPHAMHVIAKTLIEDDLAFPPELVAWAHTPAATAHLKAVFAAYGLEWHG